MNDHDIATLLREAAAPVEPPDFVADVQRRVAGARVRRAVALASLSVAAVVMAVLVAVGFVRTGDQSEGPVSPPSTPGDSTTLSPGPGRQTARPMTADLAQQPWTAARVDELGWLDIGLPRLLTGSTQDLPNLSEDPVHRALVAVETQGDSTGIVVLGDDGAWRMVDVPLVRRRDSGGYSSRALWNTSLSPDGRLLAVPQPNTVVVVDLTTGRYQTHRVPGFNETVRWSPDDRWLLLNTEERPGGSLFDLADASVTHVPYGWLATFAPNGDIVDFASSDLGPAELRTYPSIGERPTVVVNVAGVGGNIEGAGPVIGDAAVAGVGDSSGYTLPRGPADWPGVVVMDRTTGNPLALLPMHNQGDVYQAVTLGWLDETTVLVYVPAHSPQDFGHILAWNYESGQIQRISDIPARLGVSVAASQLEPAS